MFASNNNQMNKLLKFILSPISLLKLVFAVQLVFIFWMLECVLQILHYVLDVPLRWAMSIVEKLIKYLIKQL